MIINPIIPVWLMGIICVFFLILKRKGIFNYIRQIIIVLLLFVINLRVMVGNGETSVVMTNVDILFVVDNTISMLAEDYEAYGENGRRIDAVRNDCQYIMEQFPGASYSVISFGNSVKKMLPYTIDQNIVVQALYSLNGQVTLYASGTSFNDVLETLPEFLDDGRENYKIVFFISDGEITNNEELKSFSKLKKYVDSGAVLGYGTTSGGPMLAGAYSGDEDPEYLYFYDDDYEKRRAVSKIDEDNLKSIASDFGVKYIHMTDESKIDSTISSIKNELETISLEKELDSTEGYVDIYYYFVIPLVLLLIFDFIYYNRKGKVS